MTNLTQDFYSDLPANDSERKAETVKAATTICAGGKPINPTVFEASSEFERQSYRLEHGTNVIHENFNRHVSPTKLQSAMDRAGGLSKYTPLVGSYNRMHNASCEVSQDDEASLERFYIATASFGIEAALVQQQVFFKTSFIATRYTTNMLSLMKVRTVVGDKGYGLLLSEIHWAYRGGQQGATAYIISKTDDFDINKSNVEREAIENAANDQSEKYRKAIEDEQATVGNTTRIMEECAERSKADDSDRFLDRASDRLEGFADDLTSGLDGVSGVTADDIPERVNESIDQPRAFTSCMEEQLNDK